MTVLTKIIGSRYRDIDEMYTSVKMIYLASTAHVYDDYTDCADVMYKIW